MGWLEDLAGSVGGYLTSLSGPASQPQQIQNLAKAGFPGAQQMTAQQPQQSGLPPMPTPSFLDNPKLQGALGAYFGAIGSPRRAGLGGMISRGGLGGLSAYSNAQQNQLKPYLTAAQVAQSQAQTGLAQANTGRATAQTQQITSIQQTNATNAANINTLVQQGKLTPTQAQRATAWANSVANDASKVHNINEGFEAIYKEPLEEQKIGAETAGKEAETSLVPLKAGEIKASTAASEASAGATTAKLPGELEKTKSDIAKNEIEMTTGLPKAPPELAPEKRAETIASTREKLGKDFDAANSALWKTLSPTDYQKRREEHIRANMGGSPAAARPPATTDPAHMASRLKPGESYGSDSTGRRFIIHPDGSYTPDD